MSDPEFDDTPDTDDGFDVADLRQHGETEVEYAHRMIVAARNNLTRFAGPQVTAQAQPDTPPAQTTAPAGPGTE